MKYQRYQLVLMLNKNEIEVILRIQVIHVSGKRMIARGTYGLSRGLMTEGFMSV